MNKVLADIGNTLGITSATMRVIERRDVSDAYLVFAGMIVTGIVIYFCYFYFGFAFNEESFESCKPSEYASDQRIFDEPNERAYHLVTMFYSESFDTKKWNYILYCN